MKSIKTLIFVIAASMVLVACEKEIDLDLNESEQLIVVEGIVHDYWGDNFVKLSRTRAYDNNGAIEKISNATVTVSDGVGGVFTLSEVDTVPGLYTSPTLRGVAGRTYELNVSIGDIFITSSSMMNPKTIIDTLIYEEETVFSDGDEKEYRIEFHFKDSANYENFYRVKAYTGGEQADGYMALTDEYFDGLDTFFPIFEMTFELEDSITVELLTVDEPNYRYFTAVNNSQGGEVPGNPQTNLVGDKVVGYFGAYAKSSKSIKIIE